MKSALYKQRKNRLVCGVCVRITDRLDWDLPLTRALTALLMYFYGFGIVIYILLVIFPPYEEGITRDHYGTGPRRRKGAEIVGEDDDNDGWFW